ncbi:MAG: hypothetical protein ED556_09745 [Winogradskyella sp.]|uniref:WbqC family protein n=1 Tax=Winogradskyella sp. TaxID=1883156 RepID=UPI000F3EC4D9|nr:WbqC family protein [Winogradskyella sp.]RNC84857.1 MAG: hypothetical protein ED556_09745 [Winogradskyella sp.]
MLLHPTYFPNIAHFKAMISSENLIFEVCDNYQKQTYRNRAEIYAANGKLALSVPVSYTQKHRQQTKDVLISGTEQWQAQHLKSLDSAYRMSPFYEFYRDDLRPIFNTKFKYLLDVTLMSFELLCECLELNIDYKLSDEYAPHDNEPNDYRYLVNAKVKDESQFLKYTQVFTQKHGYLPNLSILDLLFNEGPNTINHLNNLDLNN